MIVRPQQHWFPRLFVWRGSVLPNILSRLALNALMASAAVMLYPWYKQLGIHLTTAPFSILGVAIAIFLGFRNNTSYARYTEARQLLGGVLIHTRTFVRELKSLYADPALVRHLSRLLLAYTWALKHQLRGTDPSADFARLLPEAILQQIHTSPLPSNRLLLLINQWLGEQRLSGVLSDRLYTNLNEHLNQLSHVQGGCERLASTPIPFAYTLILHRTVYLFCTMLPFALVDDLRYLTPIVSVFISYTFLSLEAIAEELEDPFGTTDNDLPLNAICTTIEIHLKELSDDYPLPPRPQADAYYRLT